MRAIWRKTTGESCFMDLKKPSIYWIANFIDWTNWKSTVSEAIWKSTVPKPTKFWRVSCVTESIMHEDETYSLPVREGYHTDFLWPDIFLIYINYHPDSCEKIEIAGGRYVYQEKELMLCLVKKISVSGTGLHRKNWQLSLENVKQRIFGFGWPDKKNSNLRSQL